MDNPKISIIVPVHNAGTYFEKCLNSLVNQTLREIEIILVLDCPTDGSDKIAEDFANKDNRIKLIYNSTNLHTGLSRNKGMEVAQGKYIGFLDHDDYCDPKMYELLYQKVEDEDLDIVRCNYTCIYAMANNGDLPYTYPEVSTNMMDKNWVYEYVSNGNISCVIWNHIYKADFLKQHNIQFLDSRTICSEDSIFFMEVYDKATSLDIVANYLYYHIFHASNTGKIYDYRSIKNRISFFEEIYAFLKKNEISEEKCISYMAKNVIGSLYTGSRQAVLLFPLKKSISEIQQIRKSALMMKCINYLYTNENRHVLRSLKPTIKVFSFIIKSLGAK